VALGEGYESRRRPGPRRPSHFSRRSRPSRRRGGTARAVPWLRSLRCHVPRKRGKTLPFSSIHRLHAPAKCGVLHRGPLALPRRVRPQLASSRHRPCFARVFPCRARLRRPRGHVHVLDPHESVPSPPPVSDFRRAEAGPPLRGRGGDGRSFGKVAFQGGVNSGGDFTLWLATPGQVAHVSVRCANRDPGTAPLATTVIVKRGPLERRPHPTDLPLSLPDYRAR